VSAIARNILTFPVVALFIACTVFPGCRKPTPTPSQVDPDLFEFDLPARTTPEIAVKTAPDFERVALDGTTFRMRDGLDRITLVNFWATWCAPCVAETPELVQLYKEFRGDGLIVVGVSLDDEGFDAVKGFAAEYDVSYPMILDDGISDQFGGLYGLPMSFLVGPGGQVVERYTGRVPVDALRRRIVSLLSSGPDEG